MKYQFIVLFFQISFRGKDIIDQGALREANFNKDLRFKTYEVFSFGTLLGNQ